MKYLSLFSLLLPLFTFAQSNFQEGFVLKTNGDTLTGYINVREWGQNPNSIEFKAAIADRDIIKFTPADLLAFYAGKANNYLSYTGPLSNNKTRFPNLDSGVDTTTKQQTVFLQSVLTGNNVSLYSYVDNLKQRFFYKERGLQPVELKYYYYYSGGTDNIASKKTYVGQILVLMGKYGRKNEKSILAAERASFTQTDLHKVFQLLNEPEADQKNSVSNSRFFIGAGISRITTKFEGETRFANGPPSTTNSPLINLGIDFFVNPLVQRLILRGEISFSHASPSITGSYTGYLNKPVYDVYLFDQYNINFTPQLINNFYNTDNIKIYAGIGVNFTFSQYANNKITLGEMSEYDSQPYVFRSFWASVPVQAGFVLNKRIEGFVTYVLPSQYANNVYFTVSNQVWNVGVKYLFQKKIK